jgi:hypothetical protein
MNKKKTAGTLVALDLLTVEAAHEKRNYHRQLSLSR